MILIKLLLLPVTLALSLLKLALRTATGLVGFAIGHIVLLAFVVLGFLLLAR